MVRGRVEYESKRPDVPDQLRVNPKLKVRKCIDMMMMVPMTMMGVLMMLTIGLTWKRKTNCEWTRNCEGGTAKAAGK